jgi:putative phosphoribosyl transferase
MELPIADRATAGRALAQRLKHYRNRDDVMVLALPRGGVPVAYEIAMTLNLPLDVMVVRKLGVPRHKEFAMGAIAQGGVRMMNAEVIQAHRVSDEHFEQVAQSELTELKRREHLYRGDQSPLDLHHKNVILVDDGMATGATMRAGIEAARRLGATKIIMAVPVGAIYAINELAQWTDESVWLATPDPFYAVGRWYEKFDQTSDEEVERLLAKVRAHRRGGEPQFIQYPPPGEGSSHQNRTGL